MSNADNGGVLAGRILIPGSTQTALPRATQSEACWSADI